MTDKQTNNEEIQKPGLLEKCFNLILKISPNGLKKYLEPWFAKYLAFRKTTWGDIIETVVFVVVMVILIRFFVGEIRYIPSGSMTPTLIVKDRIVVERYSRFFTRPKRGDIMIFYPPSTVLSHKPLPTFRRLIGIFCNDTAYIKRVVGLPGDKVEIKFEPDGAAYVYINDKKYEEDYIKSKYDFTICPKVEDVPLIKQVTGDYAKCGPFKLGKDDYFMMGDNRGDSFDGRYWGTITHDRFIGRAVFLFWPLNRIRVIKRIKTDI